MAGRGSVRACGSPRLAHALPHVAFAGERSFTEARYGSLESAGCHTGERRDDASSELRRIIPIAAHATV